MPDSARPSESGRFRPTLVRVMIVQIITLLGLWLLQSRYAS
jgi:hypothetical protein